MAASGDWVTVGIDNGGTANNGTVLDSGGRFLVDTMAELPSLVREGPDKAITALVDSLDKVLAMTGVPRERSGRSGSTRRARPARTASSSPAGRRTSGTRLGPGSTSGAALRERARAFPSCTTTTATPPPSTPTTCGTARTRGTELGLRDRRHRTRRRRGRRRARHQGRGRAWPASSVTCRSRWTACLRPDQPVPACNCGQFGDAESVASLTGITRNLLPYWLTRFPGHELAEVADRPGGQAGPRLRRARRRAGAGDLPAAGDGDRRGSSPSRPSSPIPTPTSSAAGVIEAAPHFRDWFVATVKEHTVFYVEQAEIAEITLVPDLDMAGARGSAIAASDVGSAVVRRGRGTARAVTPRSDWR